MKFAYVDTSVWIARFEGLPQYRAVIENAVSNLIKEGWLLCASDLVQLEAFNKPFRENNNETIQFYHSLFERLKIFESPAGIFRDASPFVQKEQLKPMDSCHVALAVQNQCGLFVTADSHFKNLSSLPVHLIDLISAV